MTRFTQRKDGEWFAIGNAHLVACCDCGLVHLVETRIVNRTVWMRGTRMPQHTGGRRAALSKAAKKSGARNVPVHRA